MGTTITIYPRDVRVAYADRREGDPYTVTLTHKPSGKSATGKGRSLGEAREIADRELYQAVAGRAH